MNTATATNQIDQAYELRFRSLFDDGKALTFPCNARGEVDMDGLSQRARDNYLFARALIGRQFAWPDVRSVTLH